MLKGRKKMKGNLQKVVSALLLLAVVLAISPTAHADSTQNFTNSETYLRTSYNNDNYVELSISGNTLTVSGKLIMDGLTGLRISCGDQSVSVDAASGQVFSARVSLSHSGAPPLSIYTQKNGEHTYWSYMWNRIRIEKTSGGYRIVPSSVLERNLAFSHAYVDPDHFRDSSSVPDSVKALSNQIAGGGADNYAKIFLLHKWVAENIYYDYDAYRGGKSTFYNSAEILANKRSVCEGYANLLRDLILAQEIPCMKTTTFALGSSTNGGTFALTANEIAASAANTANTTNTSNNSNHAHVEAWVDERWVIMDATWDSNNKYENGVYSTDAPNGFYYFDITPEALSLDHRYVTRANGEVTMQNGIINKDTAPAQSSASASPTKFTDVPASSPFVDAINWAVEQGITTGKTDTAFAPGEECTNGQILAFLWRANGSSEPSITNPFKNEIPGAFQKAALWAYEKGLIGGTAFHGDTPCTRGDAVSYLWKLAGSPSVLSAKFTDVPDTADYAQAVAWAVERGITSGISKITFGPEATCTRGQIVTFLYRAYK